VKRKQDRRPEDAVPPHCPDSERSVIGSIWIDATLMDSVAELLKPDDFYLPHTSRVYAEMLAMRRDGVPIDTTLLMGRLRDAGALKDDADSIVSMTSLVEMADSVPTAANGMFYAEKVALRAEQRRTWLIGPKLMRMGLDDYNAAENYGSWRSEIEAALSIIFRASSKANGPQIITAAELMKREFPEQKWVVPGVFVEGLNLLAGKPKFGKSWLVLSLAIAVAKGGKVFGKIDVTAGDVLYLALEDNDRRLKKRIGILLCGDDAPDRLHRATTWKRCNEGGIDDLRAWLVAHLEARLVVIDTLKRFKPKSNAKANAYDSDYEAMIPLQALAAEFGVCIIVVHHTNRGKKDDILDSVNGSNGLAGGADSILVAQKERGKVDGSLFLTGRDVEEKTLGLKWDSLTCTWTLIGEFEQEQLSIGPERLKIIKVLADEVPAHLGPSDVADKLGQHEKHERDAIRVLMSLMASDGQITAVSRGKYTVTASAQASVEAF
jgi:hypothetical protein